MRYDTTKKLAVMILAAIFLAGMIGCSGSGTNKEAAAGSGTLQAAFTAPSDVLVISVDIYLGPVCTGTPALPQVLITAPVGGWDFASAPTTLYTALHADDYCVKAEAVSTAGVAYDGYGTTYVHRDMTNLLNILLNQSNMSTEGNSAPVIRAVRVVGVDESQNEFSVAVLATEIDPNANPELYVPAPDENVMVNISAAQGISDADGDTLIAFWTVKDGPAETDSDVGTIIWPIPPTLPWFVWSHDVEGKYYVTLKIEDGNGGTAKFQFPIYVWRGEGDLEVTMEFNSAPSLTATARIAEANYTDLSDVSIRLTGTADDMEGDTMAVLWTEDCGGMTLSDPTALTPDLEQTGVVPVGLCEVMLSVTDEHGAENTSTLTLNLGCTPLGTGFDPQAPNMRPINLCFKDMMCDPSLEPPGPLDCATTGAECGTGEDVCGNVQVCGACPPAGRPDDLFCGIVSPGICSPCQPTILDPCGDAGYVCGTAFDDCGNEAICGACPDFNGCAPDQLSCECTDWMCVYGNNNELPGDLYRPKQCDDLTGAGADEAAAFTWCDTFTIGGIFEPFEPAIACGQCEVTYLPVASGRDGSPPVPIGGICNIQSDAVMPRNAFSENTQSPDPLVECDGGELYTGAWACDAYGGIWTCYL